MHANHLLSAEELGFLRESIRGFLGQRWPPEQAVNRQSSPEALAEIWRGLAQQGLTELGAHPDTGGLQVIVLVLEELGRAACPVNLPAAALANLALSGISHNGGRTLLEQITTGESLPALALGKYDGAIGAGCLEVGVDSLVTGQVRFVEGLQSATHLLATLDNDCLGIAMLADATMEITESPGLAQPALSSVRLNQQPMEIVPLEQVKIPDLQLLYRLLLTARALGAARRGFELAVTYAAEREQFGQPIGRFQAIQHKLADCLIRLEGTQRLADSAAVAFDRGAHWRFPAAAVCAYASPALRQVSLETHHVLGAIGYAEEHEAPRHFRRCHADLVRLGGVIRAREDLARYLIDGGNDLPEYDIGAEGNTFREEVREWLENYWTPKRRQQHRSMSPAAREFDRDFTEAIGKKGWHALSWPQEHGGQNRSPLEQLAFIEEIQRAGAPRAARGDIQAHALIQFGNHEQQEQFLPGLHSGEIKFCLGYSEPGAGSDLAALQTQAVLDGDEWVINGQKLWTTFAEQADYMWLAARTDSKASPRHAGISVFIVPMDSPGITIQPAKALYGHNFCTEFLDDVRVPANALVGEVNQGWKIITSALATERVTMGGFVALIRANFEALLAQLRRMPKEGSERARIGELAAEIEVARQLLVHSVELMEQGKVPIHEAAMSKAFTGELMERVAEASLDILGTAATLSEGSPGAPCEGRLEHMLRRSIMMVIGGGTAEIQRNLIAQRGLGLPR